MYKVSLTNNKVTEKNPKLVNNRFKPLVLMGVGSYGEIYRGEDVNTGAIVAIKFELSNDKTKKKSVLKGESKITKAVGKMPSFADFYWYGREDDHEIMVLEMLGRSFRDI